MAYSVKKNKSKARSDECSLITVKNFSKQLTDVCIQTSVSREIVQVSLHVFPLPHCFRLDKFGLDENENVLITAEKLAHLFCSKSQKMTSAVNDRDNEIYEKSQKDLNMNQQQT